MRINFLLPTISLSGGVKVVFEYANRLHARGHQVTVIYPEWPLIFSWPCREWYNPYRIVYGVLHRLRKRKNKPARPLLDWFDLTAKLVRVPSLSEQNISEADIVIATHWATAYHARRYSANKGRKFYFIQHHEIIFGRKDKVEKTYQMELGVIVVSTWLKKIVEQRHGIVRAVIPDGIDFRVFYPERPPDKHDHIRILLPYRHELWKGIAEGIRAFDKAKKRCPAIRLVMFGPHPRKNELPEDVEFHILPTQDRLRNIYNSCDIFVFPSWYEGFGLPPLEAMACRCAVATTEVGAMFDYAVNNKTALVSSPRDVESLADNIVRLADNESDRARIAEAGYRYVQQLTWERSVADFERIIAETE